MSEPRSELRLRELGREAQDLVDLPDLGLPWSAVAARCASGVRPGSSTATRGPAATGVFLFQDRSQQEPQPAPRSERIAPYPGPLMEDLEAGTYEMTPSSDGTDPTALVTVPSGWNSWEGPNRFDGHRDGESNEQALARSTWVVGVVVLNVQWVASRALPADRRRPGRRHGLRPDRRSRPGPARIPSLRSRAPATACSATPRRSSG